MKILSAILCCLLYISSFAQDSVQVKTYYPDHSIIKVREVFWVTANDSSIKVGPYTSYFVNGRPSVTGTFKNNERIGVWVFYDLHTLKPYLEYDFDHNQELYYIDKYDQSGLEYMAFYGDSAIQLDRMSYCPNYLPDLYRGFSIYLDRKLWENKITNLLSDDCMFHITIEITETGQILTDVTRTSCNQEVIDAIISIIKSSPKWIPGKSKTGTFSHRLGYSRILEIPHSRSE